MRAVIADDEELARKKLNVMLASEGGVQVLAQCQNGVETLRALANHKPDLLLLDIRMPDLDGFAILSQVPEKQMPLVIFTTAYDRHAVQAFEAHALDYLLKPFDQERLHEAIARACHELSIRKERETTQRILHLLSETAAKKPDASRRLIVKSGGRVVFLSVDEIDWLEAAANYVRINVGKQAYLLRRGIREIAERLDRSQFIRIHRSVIVNVQRIKELQPVNSGEYIVVLKDGKELSCSRGYRSELQELIDQMM